MIDTCFEFDSQGHMVAVNVPANSGTVKRPRYQYTFDAQGQQTLIVDPNRHETRFGFNLLGQQISRTLPLGFGADGKLGTADDASAEPFSEHLGAKKRGQVQF